MHATLPRLQPSDFPPLNRDALTTLQVNLGYRCNQSCLHCHVNAGPNRHESMDTETMDAVIRFLRTGQVETLDLTGGAPELHSGFRTLVRQATRMGLRIIDRCNLTVLEEPDQADLGNFLATHGVQVVASLPCYQETTVDAQRGAGVHDKSIRALRRLNALGYGWPDSELTLDLVFNPVEPVLPPPQANLEADYRRVLRSRYGIEFTRLLALANLPVQRFGSMLVSRGQFDTYLLQLKSAYREDNLTRVMCRSLVSVDWRGYLYDCDFNQMLGLTLGAGGPPRPHIRDLTQIPLRGQPIHVADHCYGCTAGQGSGCGGALTPVE